MNTPANNLANDSRRQEAGRMRRPLTWQFLAYFLGVPLAVAVYACLNNWEMQNVAGLPATMAFYLGHSLIPWLLTCSLTFGTKLALQRWKPPWIMLLLTGHTLGCLLIVPYTNWFTGLFESRWPGLEIMAEVTTLLSLDFWIYWVRAGVIWVLINFLFDRFLGLPLYRYEVPRGYDYQDAPQRPAAGSGWPEQPPGFVQRLPARLNPEEILAIKAEQHYIRVFSPEKEFMVLYRFSDAIRELDESMGNQVHRSWWVNTSAIEYVRARAKDFAIHIKGNNEVPVSTPYQGMVRELARASHIPLRG